MRLSIFCSLLLALQCSWVLPGAEPVRAVRAAGKVTLDGKLDEAAWAKAPPVASFTNPRTGRAATTPTEARILYDNHALYIGIKASMPDGAKYVPNDKNLYAGECVEVMLDPGATRNVYFHFMTNPNGVQNDEFRDQGGFVGNPKWNAEWAVKTFRTPEYWSCEFRIPFAALDFPVGENRTWAVNIARGARGLPPGEGMEDGSIAADGAYHIAGKFPELTGFDRSFEAYGGWQLGAPEVSVAANGDKIALSARVAAANQSAEERRGIVALDFIAPDGKTARRKTAAVKLDAQKSETLEFGGYEFAEPGVYRAVVTVRDPKTKRVLKQSEYAVPVTFQILKINLQDPHYKNAIFATMKLDAVRYHLNIALPAAEIAGQKLTSGIRSADGKILGEKTVAAAPETAFEFPVAPLPDGAMTIFAELRDADGKVAAESTHPLRKLPYLAGEVWMDKNGYIYVDGKPFFVIGQWTSRDDFLEGVNVFLDWESYRGAKILSPLFSHTQALNQLRKKTTISSAEAAEIRRLVAREMQKPELFAYYLSDEPEVFGDTVEALKIMYKLIDEVDPYHPVVISNDTEYGVRDYAEAADLNGVHAYPRTSRTRKFANFEKLGGVFDQFQASFAGRPHRQSLLWLAQGFDYTNFAAVNTSVPRAIELRNEYLMSLIAGSRGVLFYNTLNEHDPEIGIGLAEFARELVAYAPVLGDPGAALNAELKPAGFRALVKKYNGEIWIFAAQFGRGTARELELVLPELKDRKLKVMAEGRMVQARDGVLRDRFDDFAVHVYTTDLNAPDLRTTDDIEKAVNAVHAARRKPGNLAYQRYENEVLQANASSNMAFNVRADNCLWHVTDGMIEPENFRRYNDQQVVWSDKTPNAFPDWLELVFKKPVTVGKVMIYPVENTLQDYQIQVWKNAAWVTVADVRDESGAVRTHAFEPVMTDKIRLLVTATRGPHVRIAEIEVYEK